MRLNIYITAINREGIASDPVPMQPQRFMVIGRVSSPENVNICVAGEEGSIAGCSDLTPELALWVTWTKPSDTGAGGAEVLPISRYEVVLSEDRGFSVGIIRINITSSMAEGAGGVCKALVSNLIKGKAYCAQVRGFNQVGPGEWGQLLGDSSVVLSNPSEPLLQFIGSGGAGAPFLTVFWKPPLDSGAGIGSSVTVDMKIYRIQVGTSLNIDATSIVTLNIDMEKNVSLITFSGGMYNLTMRSSSRFPLTLGMRYFLRIQANNGINFGGWSMVSSRILVQDPSAPSGDGGSTSKPTSSTAVPVPATTPSSSTTPTVTCVCLCIYTHVLTESFRHYVPL